MVPRSRSRSSRASSAATVGGLGVVARAARRGARARPRARRRRPRAARSRLACAATSSAPSSATRSVHGVERVPGREPGCDPPQRRVSLRRPQRRSRPAGPREPGNSRPSARSKYARRAAGPPLTTASRSGVKTSVATSRRSCSAERSGAPFSRARLPSPAAQRHLELDVRRPAFARERHARGVRARTGRAARPRAFAARTPACRRAAPRAGSSCRRRSGPSTSTSPGSSASSSRAYERKSRSVTSRTISRRAGSA